MCHFYAVVSTVFGIIIGPYAIGIFDPAGWGEFDAVTLELTRIVIAVQVMAAGVSLPRSYVLKEKLSLFMMLVPLMVLMWLTSALIIWGLIPNIGYLEAMVIATCITPTDPVLSNSVVKGRFAEKHVPPRLRNLLSAESGVNDGMGVPFLFLAYYLLTESSTGVAIGKWFYIAWAYQVTLSIVVGGVVGFSARKLVKGAKSRNLIDKESFLVFSIALALAVVGIVSIMGSDDLLACFIAGNVFAWDDWFSNEIAEAHIQEIIDMLLNLACFVYIGASIPFSSFGDSTLGLSVWRMIVMAIVILIFRRLPFVMALKPFIPALTTYREAAFAGWFGPIGVGAVFYSKVIAMHTDTEHLEHAPQPERLERIRAVTFPVVMFLVFSSVMIHGVTVPLLHLQYKYTRTWSRKREDSNHAVTRLPHINIGDEIVLRPPTINGDGDGSGNEQRTIGYDNQRSIGFDNQRSIGYDHQRSVNQRSFGYGNSVPYGGFGIAGVPDLSRTSQSNNNTVRTLQDVVKEMKDASRGTAANRNLRVANNNNNTDGKSTPNPRDSLTINFNNLPSPREGRTSSSRPMSPVTASSANAVGKESEEISQSLKRDHPVTHASDPRGVSEAQLRSQSDGSNSDNSSSSTAGSKSESAPIRPPHQPISSVVEIHEVEREEDNGIVREVSHDIDVDSTQAEQLLRESGSESSLHIPHPHLPHLSHHSSSQSQGHSSGHHHLTDLFKPQNEKE
ncbi:hypothetical protein BGZ80_001586 [Entomortierella chlamydospora]|uniref:Cation/H+ exchanger transmembrane domain-containing protein n=1 Tax=Entomortierella chlamydospora TaxID=101097 RepID=A0A9P6MRH0_9FUNG|nr:hypothetical protein BGZ79_002440 [Entomortierella chlamydospora]KAG0010327.1 hypothetical protein BGZ80_001586 [Entomortierella chlamydospora]